MILFCANKHKKINTMMIFIAILCVGAYIETEQVNADKTIQMES